MLADAHGLQYRISSAAGQTLQNQRTCLARNYVFIKYLWVTSVTQPSHECLVALDVSRTLAQGGWATISNRQMEGLVACPSERPEDIPLVCVTHVAQAEDLQGKKARFLRSLMLLEDASPLFPLSFWFITLLFCQGSFGGQKVTLSLLMLYPHFLSPTLYQSPLKNCYKELLLAPPLKAGSMSVIREDSRKVLN